MQSKAEKIILVFFCAVVIIGGFEALIYILNLNQVGIFLATAEAIYLYLVFKILFLYDLHFKRTRAGQNSAVAQVELVAQAYWGAFFSRTRHFFTLSYVGKYLNYLLLPTLIFWSTVIILYLNFGQLRVQQAIVFFSSLTLIAAYWYIKEIFSRRTEKVDAEIFVRMTVIKIYAAGISYAAAMALMRSYCLSGYYFAGVAFAVTFSLIFQALFQHRLNSNKNILINFFIALAQSLAAFFVYKYWGLNFYTAAIFLVIIYNLLWGVFHYHLDRALTKKTFLEILIISLLMAAMIFSATDFRARILDGCVY